jgi:hypothetical protein
MMCLESAGRLPLGDYRRATLYSTLSPCAMCAGAVLHYQIPRIVIADSEHFQGEEMLLMTRGVEVMSLDFPDAKVLVKEFIELHPDLWAEDSGAEVGSSSAPPPRLGTVTPQAALPAPAEPPAPALASEQPAAALAAPQEPLEAYAPYAPSAAENASAYAPSYAASEVAEAPENASAYAGSAYAPSLGRGTPEPPYGSSSFPTGDDSESLPPPSAPPSIYEGSQYEGAEGSQYGERLLAAQQQ